MTEVQATADTRCGWQYPDICALLYFVRNLKR